MNKVFEKIAEVEKHYDSWWNKKNTTPIMNFSFPIEKFNLKKYRKSWMPKNLHPIWALAIATEKYWKTANNEFIYDACILIDGYLKTLEYAGDGYPALFTNFGPGNLSANITDYSLFSDNTIWFELEEPMDWKDILAINENVRTPYAEIYKKSIDILIETLSEKCLLSFPDMSSSLDILASLRHSQNLLMDLITEPDNVKIALDKLQKIWFRYQKEYHEQLRKTNKGYSTSWLHLLGKNSFYLDQSDFSAMISPEMFEEFALPQLKENMSNFKHGIYHLDGPGEIALVDSLCTIKNLHAIQWVPGAGEEPELSPKWYDLFAKIIEHDKRIILCFFDYKYDIEEGLNALFQRFPKEYFCFFGYIENKEKAEDIIRIANN